MPASEPAPLRPQDEPPLLAYLRHLVNLTGPSGSEEDVVRAVAQLARPLADTVEVDAPGNVIVTRRAAQDGARRLIIATHMDEVGFRVRQVTREGFLRLEKVGGTDDRILPAQRVWIRTDSARLLGVIGTKSAHLLTDPDRAKVVPYPELYVDIGARDAEAASAMGVRPGDPVGFVGELTELGAGSGRFTGHALDDRAGCAVLLSLLERYRDNAPPVTIIAAFTVQEEVGLRGAQGVARRIEADVALALDMTAADDTPDTGGGHLTLGAGAALKVMDFSTLAHPAVRRGLQQAADQAGLNVQHELMRGIGTDAGALQFGGQGIPTGAVSVANRYTHSPVEVLDVQDLQGALDLLDAFAARLPDLDLRFVDLPEAVGG
ncbi:M42 family metallopeptidase [Deinococcus peraridilitoris]|uniref:Peptidase family protein n=1 Tax=Deinococcus peraridilitoris (strain DSM 19664 / LMG 22246 / CIP 109416 / KR-200) TaxID=937777 RepID=L0A1K4_DEIPD|nr:M42 family metallopeptidase [Deinococcus peraridilitoris]AFZ66895.1 peptidase family protein [Deinococcus peraridilitoris DSM 19664]